MMDGAISPAYRIDDPCGLLAALISTRGGKHVHRADTDNTSIKLKLGTSCAYILDRARSLREG